MQTNQEINQEKCYDTKLKLIRKPLLKFISARIFNKQDAEDVAQNCLSILCQKKNQYDPNKSWYSWAFTICNFQIKSYLSIKKRNRILSILDKEGISAESFGHLESKMPFEDLIQGEKESVSKQIMSALNGTEKQVFQLSLKGVSPKDIIDILKITQSNYGVSKSRALKKAKILFANKSIKNYKL